MSSSKYVQFINFLEEELNIPTNSITLAWRKSEQSVVALPMILWQYGLVSVQQLEKIWDWLDNSYELQGTTMF